MFCPNRVPSHFVYFDCDGIHSDSNARLRCLVHHHRVIVHAVYQCNTRVAEPGNGVEVDERDEARVVRNPTATVSGDLFALTSHFFVLLSKRCLLSLLSFAPRSRSGLC
jgi:hypothetical protein